MVSGYFKLYTHNGKCHNLIPSWMFSIPPYFPIEGDGAVVAVFPAVDAAVAAAIAAVEALVEDPEVVIARLIS